ncbi:histidinol-phosphate transaminase [Lactiplantibacillus mudanjiangensis]|uniref:Histidinol-phosphate aminotransferase n=1 Tax=Lactiplantibacillus mudanjiangensis TaxID=1296538 RepID=A0A660DZC5_9LACO|nr:histidinol-phosphate transaminase [Lactiplantibacillus mudanjiangensis]VDG19011.1 histidinol-phosphate transaminase [Lactobacillus pentosus] [Lactiplantibacillus mudanjiangensis]VDG25501.1 histidinol-phosphate transaminase [Lactobacillus pentosus] [Lactiplantibacillus mudanjiangensis]VDG27530.1 histidinol-phosphate transaminase [Lactobacillus pentosus] [Lactiplantibacillus mudanjiangensis]
MKESVKKLQPYVPEKPLATLQAELGVNRLVRLSANENPYGTSPAVEAAVKNWDFSGSNRYPDGDATELRLAVASQQHVDPEQLVFSVGLDEMIVMVSRTFLAPGDQVLVAAPTFSEYGLHAEIEEATLVSVPTLADGHVDFPAMAQALTPDVKMVWLCNPNNPTGTSETLADLEAFIQQVPAETMVLIDEAYIDFATDAAKLTAMQLPSRYDNVVVMRTFSKAYGLANFRVGYAVFSKTYAPTMQAVRLPYNVNSLTQAAALAAVNDQNFVQTTVAKNAVERTKWEAFFDAQQIQYDRSDANFIFFKYPQADQLADYLLHHGYSLRTGLQSDWIRLTIGTAADNQAIQQLILSYQNDA